MNNETTTSMNDVSNPHDKLFRETWSNLENARSFLHHYLPHHVLRLMDLDTLARPMPRPWGICSKRAGMLE